MKKNLLLRSTILCATLLFSASICPTIIANQADQEVDAQEMQQGLEQFELMYQEITKAYDQKDIERYEESLFNELTDYLSLCAKNKKNAQNTDSIEQEVSAIIKKLAIKTNLDHAYATGYTMFILTISSAIDQIQNEILEENLTEAVDAIGKFMEAYFSAHMQEIFEKCQ